MKHQAIDELRANAELVPEGRAGRLSRRERIERWADLLEAHQGALRPFIRVEALSRHQRRALRAEDTPLALAFKDPVLRADGLRNDTLGEAMNYFDLSEHNAHRLLCDCHYRGTMTGANLAARLRPLAKGGILQRIWSWGTGRE